MKARDIQKRLASAAGKSAVGMKIVQYSSFHGDCQVHTLPNNEVVQWLKNNAKAPAPHLKRWIDVWGYNTDVMSLLAQQFKIPSGAGPCHPLVCARCPSHEVVVCAIQRR